MIPDWETNHVCFSDLLPGRHPGLWRGLIGVLVSNRIEHQLLAGTKDIWCQDYMPVQVGADAFVQFRYEPDYLKGHQDLITDARVSESVQHIHTLHTSGIILDGGNVVAARGKVLLTEKVFRENPRYVRLELRGELEKIFEATCLFVPKEPGDTIGHADGVVRFLDEDTVLVNDYAQVDPRYGQRLRAALRRHGLGVEELAYFYTGEEVDGISSAVGNYVNYLWVSGLIIVPAYGVPQDDTACRTLERLLPGTKVVPLRCEALARAGGVLNCVSWGIRTGPPGRAQAEQPPA